MSILAILLTGASALAAGCLLAAAFGFPLRPLQPNRAPRHRCGSPPRLIVSYHHVAVCQCGRRSRRRWLFQEDALADLAGRPVFRTATWQRDLSWREGQLRTAARAA